MSTLENEGFVSLFVWGFLHKRRRPHVPYSIGLVFPRPHAENAKSGVPYGEYEGRNRHNVECFFFVKVYYISAGQVYSVLVEFY